MRIKVCSDSTCDLSPALVERFGVHILPLFVTLGDKSCQDGVDITPADIYRHVAAGGDLPTTAAITPAAYAEEYQLYAAEYDAVVHINIGSGFSSCHQNACIAAADFDNVYVIDSKNLSTGHGLVVIEAAKRAAAGMDVRQLVDEVNELTSRVEASFLLDQLDYMRKGGRCSTVTALGANLLKLKPCIEVVDGKMTVVKKYRGNYEKCIAMYVRERLANCAERLETEKAFITHSIATEPVLEAARGAMAECGCFDEVFETVAGCTVSSHCGPNTLGVLFIRK